MDNVYINDIKSNIDFIAEPLAFLINLSIDSGVLQKRIIRIITLFYEYGLLNIENIHLLQVGLFMFLFNKKLLPFHTMFQKSSEIHSYSTRNASNYRSHKCRTNIRKFTISFQGPSFWNTLPLYFQIKPSYYSFKVNLKTYLIDK